MNGEIEEDWMFWVRTKFGLEGVRFDKKERKGRWWFERGNERMNGKVLNRFLNVDRSFPESSSFQCTNYQNFKDFEDFLASFLQ
jgi:hypothetical protein